MKYLRLISINILVLCLFLLVIAIISYFIGVYRINSFFNVTGPDQIAYLQKDSLAMFVHKPNIQIYDNWGTPQQKLTTERRTNNLGFREDEDILPKKRNEYRVLITGDSHTDGVLKHNFQSFANIWENKLNDYNNEVPYNIINGGTAYYTFKNYLGFIKKYKNLKPDVYIINVFTGNDFREAQMFEKNRKHVSNVFKNIYLRTIKKFYSEEKKEIPFTQGIEQTLYFKSFPSEAEKSFQLSKKYILDIKQLCAQENIKLIITLLPSKIETNILFKDRIQKLFKLSDTEIEANEDITNKFINFLNTENITNINLKESLQQATEKVYWDQDLHINPNAHCIIAETLFETINLPIN